MGQSQNTEKHFLVPKSVTKILKNPYFCSLKIVPSKGGTVTLEVVLTLTLERLKRGTKTNSPAYIYIYTYIYMAVTSIGGQKIVKHLKNAQFYSENGPEKPPQKCGCFCCIFGFFFVNFFVFFPLFLLISCCFVLSWNPKTAHQVRLQAYIYIYACCEVIIWSKFGGFWKLLSGPSWVFGSYYLVQVCVFSL